MPKRPDEDIESRAANGDARLELRDEEDSSKKTLVGYAAIFNSPTELFRDFYEEIAPGAFDGVLGDDVRCVLNHDRNVLLGRTSSGTLKLSVDERGLKYECSLPDTQVAKDLAESVGRGDVSQSSFAFRADKTEWIDLGDGKEKRVIKSLASLRDVSPVTYPAYDDTTVALREKSARSPESEPEPPQLPEPDSTDESSSEALRWSAKCLEQEAKITELKARIASLENGVERYRSLYRSLAGITTEE